MIGQVVILLIVYLDIKGISAIDCFECMSVGGQNPQCDDQFGPHNATEHLLHRKCRVGYLRFEAFFCVKIKGEKANGQSVVIRTCSMDNWGTNCGNLLFEHAPENRELLTGCLASCNYDGCNSACKLSSSLLTIIIPLTITMVNYSASVT